MPIAPLPQPATAARPARRPAARERKSANLTLPTDLIAEARGLGINLSQAAASGIAAAVAQRRQDRWLAENQGALDSSNAFVDHNGLPLARYRNF